MANFSKITYRHHNNVACIINMIFSIKNNLAIKNEMLYKFVSSL